MDREEVKEEIKKEISQYSEKTFVLAFFYDKVCIGKIKNGEIVFNDKVNYDFLTQIRIFNKEQEIRYVLDETTNEFQETKINDNADDTDNNKENDNKIYVDEDMFIIGNKEVSRNDEFVTIKQDGGNIDIPIDEEFHITQEDISKGLRLKVRNYYKQDKNKQLVFANSRLVEIGKEENNDC